MVGWEKSFMLKVENKQYDFGIAFARVAAMLSILVCHIIKYYSFIPGAAFLGQFYIWVFIKN